MNRAGPPRQRQCQECKEVFATPAILLAHRNVSGNCRPAQTLPAFGMTFTGGAWRWKDRPEKPPGKYARAKR
jgi:hypothetical protein